MQDIKIVLSNDITLGEQYPLYIRKLETGENEKRCALAIHIRLPKKFTADVKRVIESLTSILPELTSQGAEPNVKNHIYPNNFHLG